MTTGESIDNIEKVDMENVTVTSDVAYKRVTSDEGFIDEGKEGYLKQNTAGLIQEIPNISFLDISDTMLESKKTLYDRENWILRVGKAGRSIEAQPQDTLKVWTEEDKTYIISPGYTDNYVEFDMASSPLHFTTCDTDDQTLANIILFKILEGGMFTISYGWTLEPNSATWFKVIVGVIGDNPRIIQQDYYKGSALLEIMSGGKYTPNIELKEGDVIYMKIQADDAIKMYKDTYMNIQFQQYI